tara:strand:- start:344 stop:1303 length:960 start_codon:yes stop_codon:yes gene_type:complete
MIETFGTAWETLVVIFSKQLFSIGTTSVTALGLVQVLVAVVVAILVSRAIRGALSRIGLRWAPEDRSALYTIGRIIHYAVLTFGWAVGLSIIGVDLTNLAVLLGALGIGIGFGLQDTVANFIAGVIILFERHVRVHDFIELESGLVGEVREIRMRATRVVTNNNIDILVPNSEFIRGRVTNWTLDEADRRIRVPFGVGYGSDKEKVRKAALEAATRVPHTLTGMAHRLPQVWLVQFGDSSLDFELVVWLTPEAVKLPFLVKAEYLWEIHSSLMEHGIEIPFPQRDLHLRSLFGLDEKTTRAWVAERQSLDDSQRAVKNP